MAHLGKLFLIVLFVALDGNHVHAGSKNKYKPYVVTRWYDLRGVDEAAIPYTDCGSTADLKNVQVIPCDSEDSCTLQTGGNATFILTFVSKVESKTLTSIVHGIVAGVPVPFHLPHSDACTLSGIKCPIEPGQNYVYTVVLPILKNYPKISVKVKWEIQDDNKNDVVCIEIPAHLR